MNLTELIRLTGRLFERYRVPYFTFGAVGMGLWIEARATKDIDIVINPNCKGFHGLCGELKRNGVELTRPLLRKLREGRIIRVPVSGRIARIDIKSVSANLDRTALTRSKAVRTKDLTLNVATPEDIILYKLISYRPQDMADITRIRKEYKQLNIRYIASWIPKLQRETGLPISKRWSEAGLSPSL